MDQQLATYRGYLIRTYRRRSQKYIDHRISFIQRPDGSFMDLVELKFAHWGKTGAGNKILLRSNVGGKTHESTYQYILPHIDAELDNLVFAEFKPDTLDGKCDWMPKNQCEYIDQGPGMRKYWKVKKEFVNG